MKCPSCGRCQTFVTRSVNNADETSRVREYRCDICHVEFKTIEILYRPKGEKNAKN